MWLRTGTLVFHWLTEKTADTVLIGPLWLDNQLSSQRDVLQSGFGLAIGAIWWSVVFGEGSELEAVEGVLPTSHVLHRVLPAAALAEKRREQVKSCDGTHLYLAAAALAASEKQPVSSELEPRCHLH